MKANATNTLLYTLAGIAAAGDYKLPPLDFTVSGDCIIAPEHVVYLDACSNIEPMLSRVFDEPANSENPALVAALDRCRNLPKNWDSFGAGPISEIAIRNARQAVDELRQAGIVIDRIAPTPDDSVLMETIAEGASVLIEFFGTGEIGLVKREGPDQEIIDLPSVEALVSALSESLFVRV
jgi:hypothetical protein